MRWPVARSAIWRAAEHWGRGEALSRQEDRPRIGAATAGAGRYAHAAAAARRSNSLMHHVGLLGVASVTAGLLTAALALPAVGALGVLANTADRSFSSLPTYLAEPPLAQRSVLRAADGSDIATLAGAEDRVDVPLQNVPAVLQKSIVAVEDNRFYQHQGVDLPGLLRAITKDAAAGGYAQGASTITQQLVKNTLLETASNSNADPAARMQAQQEATGKSLARKIREARYAIALEKRLTKAQILERYLNIAYFGEGVYGVAAAARHYFGIPVQKVSLSQAALLAGLINNPAGFDPVQHPRAAQARRNEVLDAVRKYGFLPAAQVQAARRQPMIVHPAHRAVDPCAVSRAPFFCAYVLRQLLADPQLGATQAERDRRIFEGGLDIATTWSASAQKAVDDNIHAALPNTIAPVSGVVVMQPGTGQVLAIGQNRAYGTGPAQTTQVFPMIRGEQVGSSFKAFTLAAALEAGLPLTTSFYSPVCYIPPFAITGKDPGARCPGGISNAGDSESGTFNMVDATWQSVNTYYTQLELKVGIPQVAKMAKLLGIHSPGLDTVGAHDLSVTLGAVPGDLSILDMATGYATLAAHGRECQPMTVTSITSKNAPVPFTGPGACQQVIAPATADTVTSVLQGVLNQPLGTAQGKALDRPSAGKTGTLDNYKGAWFIGYVPQYVTAIGLWNPAAPNNTLLPLCATGIGCFTNHLYGGDIPASLWRNIMTSLVAGQPVQNFTFPEQVSPFSVAGPAAPTGTPPPATAGPNQPGIPQPNAAGGTAPTRPSASPVHRRGTNGH